MNLVTFAEAKKLTPAEAVVLPALFEKAAQEVGMTRGALITAAHTNSDVGDYLASVARKVAAELEAA